MPEFTIDEADKCPHCGAILHCPPACCMPATEDYYGQLEDLRANGYHDPFFTGPNIDAITKDIPDGSS